MNTCCTFLWCSYAYSGVDVAIWSIKFTCLVIPLKNLRNFETMVSKPQFALLFAALCFTACLFGQIATDETPFIEHEILVMLANDVQPDKVLTELAEDVDFQILSVPSPSTNIYLVHVDGPNWAEALGKFKSHRHVRAAQLNHLVSERETVPNDPNFGQQWHRRQSSWHSCFQLVLVLAQLLSHCCRHLECRRAWRCRRTRFHENL